MGSLTSSQAAFIGGFLGVIAVAMLAFYVLVVIAYWRIFTKAGYAGWKSLIPFYNQYLIFKMSWKTMFFWIMLGCIVIGGILESVGAGGTSGPGALYYVGVIAILAGCVLACMSLFYLGKSFGHGVGFFILMLILPNIAMLYLGFSKDQYLGNLSE